MCFYSNKRNWLTFTRERKPTCPSVPTVPLSPPPRVQFAVSPGRPHQLCFDSHAAPGAETGSGSSVRPHPALHAALRRAQGLLLLLWTSCTSSAPPLLHLRLIHTSYSSSSSSFDELHFHCSPFLLCQFWNFYTAVLLLFLKYRMRVLVPRRPLHVLRLFAPDDQPGHPERLQLLPSNHQPHADQQPVCKTNTQTMFIY